MQGLVVGYFQPAVAPCALVPRPAQLLGLFFAQMTLTSSPPCNLAPRVDQIYLLRLFIGFHAFVLHFPSEHVDAGCLNTVVRYANAHARVFVLPATVFSLGLRSPWVTGSLRSFSSFNSF